VLSRTLNLASLVKRRSGKPIVLANIATTQAQATDLLAVYAKALAAWSAGIPRIMAEYEATVREIRTVHDSAATTTGAIDDVAAEIRRLVLTLTPELRRWALRVETVHRDKWVRSVLSATDVDLSTVLSPFDVNETLDASLNWNVSLIRDVSDELRRKVSNSVFAGFQRRAPAREIAKEITEATGMARSRARRIAADQTVKLGSRLNQARQEQAGLTSFKWRHSGKVHPRSWHKARDGNVYPWRGNSIPADDMPGVPPFCGCVAQGVITFD
jgi:SPP1 gp7 family putative phage head morphogenesis protein